MMMQNRENLWPGWDTVRLIGQGSFGAVYEIQRDVYGRTEKAALKVISIPQNDSDLEELYDNGYDDASVTATFKSHLESIVSEYSLMREMNGAANVVNCDDYRVVPHSDNIGWDIYIKMELLTPLTKALEKGVNEDQVVRIGMDICQALVLCKKYNVVHRDIKPQNIFVSKNGDYKLGDFGIAKTMEHTTGGTKVGTYKYMAPEVYNNQPYNQTADIYSLGLVLYWLLNERRIPFMPLPPEPVTVSMEEEARRRRFQGEPLPAPANGSKQLKQVILKACAFDPKDRYQSADEMLADLEKCLPEEQKKQPTAKKKILIGIVAGALVVIALAVALVIGSRTAKPVNSPSKETSNVGQVVDVAKIPAAIANMDPDVQRPQESSFLKNYSTETKIIQTHHGVCANLRLKLTGDVDTARVVYEGEQVTVYAYEGDYALVETEDGRMGWVKTDFLLDEYTPYYDTLEDGSYLVTIKSVNKPGDVFYVATVQVIQGEGGKKINEQYRLRIANSAKLYGKTDSAFANIEQLLSYYEANVSAVVKSVDGKIEYVGIGDKW